MPVYFIQARDGTGLVKIGYAADPPKRLAEIQRMSPVALRILFVIEGEREREKEIHLHFSHLRLHGEWFSPANEIFDFVKTDPLCQHRITYRKMISPERLAQIEERSGRKVKSKLPGSNGDKIAPIPRAAGWDWIRKEAMEMIEEDSASIKESQPL